ncbi:type IX secretion system sortase PorU [Dyadobacter psychrotolerans]|uniref:Type IX secretion system sortase PorU n=1 Tax=Dyadobacter psychrotolerans TaxID=2541721 RepID=A0A4R5DE09_9BACT|nr:type IX secretion system sortase PorU [Dyadobacter psychrotolerans]TDE12076.1 type IX secretion system sortase PorU [Dyadobacter psychrotolerans]
MHWLKHVDFNGILSRSIFCLFGLSVCLSAFGQQSSVLSSGNWFKLEVTKTGVYKIDANLLKSMGLRVSDIDPAKIQIFGNGGGMLPQGNSVVRNTDLKENAIWVKGGDDGRFDSEDAVFFYAEGPNVILYDSVNTVLSHQTNIYTGSNYYFLRVGSANGLRIKNAVSVPDAGSKVVTDFTDYWYHEKESVNMLRSGREWLGEYLAGSTAFTVQADMPGILPSSPVRFVGSAVGAAQVGTRFIWQMNGQSVGESTIGTVGANTYDIKGQRSDVIFNTITGAQPPSAFTVGVQYDRSGQGSAQAYLNYAGIQVKRELRAYDQQQVYHFLPETQGTVTYQIKNIRADWLFWNITDIYNPSSTNFNSTSSVTVGGGLKLRKYVGFTISQAFVPDGWESVSNQNLSASTVPDLLIITPASWESQAKRLASFRGENDGLDVLVVTTPQVYNEYASGKPDLTAIRDFAKQLFKKQPGKLKYLLLFGDATYDYKNNLENQTEAQREGWLPVYESRESLNPVYTYSSDDYYGFMEDGEGNWPESASGDHTMDIGVGRLPVKSVQEAKIVVDKLIRYGSSPKGLDSWRNTVSFVADDGDGNVHQRHADQLAQLINNDFLPTRIFLDAFPQTTTSGGQKVPAVNAAIKKSIKNGTLVLNYTGHGGTSGWAEEQVLTIGDMLSARGLDNLPLLLTATCDFGRYDDLGLVSGAELMVLSPKGGAIGAVSTTRPVYSSTNFTLNKAFYEALSQADVKTRLGDIFRETKNKGLVGALNRNFALLGDPSMRLAKPKKSVRFVQKPDTLRALQKVKLQFEVYDKENGSRDENFSGSARVSVFDKQSVFKTQGNEGDPESYSEFQSKLFDGNVTVRNGVASFEFIMPKDIDYRTGMGRISIYAVHSDSLTDAGGQLDILVGGSVALTEDKTSPKISTYLNHTDFKTGDVVTSSPILYVKLSDDSGINVSKTGIGHDIVMTLNDTLVIVLNDYYTADVDTYKSGSIRYPFEDLPAGNYTVRIKVWDTYTNFSESAFGFQVSLASGIKLTNFKVYPNPFDRELSFELNHDRVNEDVEVTFRLLLGNGQQLGAFNWQYYNSEAVISELVTSTRIGSLLLPAILYVYTIEIRSLKDNTVDKRSGKIIRSP